MINVGLNTCPRIPNPLANPCVNVVFPVPRSPCKARTSAWRLEGDLRTLLANTAPSSRVFEADDVVDFAMPCDSVSDISSKARYIINYDMEEQKRKTFSIILRGLAPYVSQVSYERNAEDLSLYLGLRDEYLKPEQLVIKRGSSDLTIILTKPEVK